MLLPHPVYVVLGTETRASCVPGKHSANLALFSDLFVVVVLFCFSEKGSCYITQATLKLLGLRGNPALHLAKFGNYSGPKKNV